MARPTKLRKIDNLPTVQYFVPSSTRIQGGPENVLKLEELEAIRLKDLEGLEQDECAERMQVSRPTFQRILLIARSKVADSLVSGKSIAIEGGHFTRYICLVKCMDCGKIWEESYENLEKLKNGLYGCSDCSSTKITCINSCKGKFCSNGCHRRGRRGVNEVGEVLNGNDE